MGSYPVDGRSSGWRHWRRRHRRRPLAVASTEGVAAVGMRLDRGLFLRRRPKRRPRDRRRRREETKAEAASWGGVIWSAVGIRRRVVREGAPWGNPLWDPPSWGEGGGVAGAWWWRGAAEWGEEGAVEAETESEGRWWRRGGSRGVGWWGSCGVVYWFGSGDAGSDTTDDDNIWLFLVVGFVYILW
jgi:hypothetical protein